MKLDVGKKYRTREGEIVTIERLNPGSTHPFAGDNYLTFTEGGHWLGKTSSIHDLIEEIKETKMKLEVGKYYKNRDSEVVKIVKYEWQEDEEFYRCKYRTYTPHGSYYSFGTSPYDLIEEVVPVVAYRVKVSQTDMRYFQPWMEGEKGKVFTNFRIWPTGDEKFISLNGWSYYATQVDAGYIDPITKEFVMNEKESKKLKLEVGKTYKTRGGETVNIMEMISDEIYSFISEEFASYTKDGLRYDWIPDHDLNLIEEVEVETKTKTKTTIKKEQPKMKYYRTTEKNTETNIPAGTIVTLYNDDDSQMPRYKEVNSDKHQYLYTDRLEEINVKTMKTVISPASKLVKILEDSGYVVNSAGHWRKPDKETFASKMFYFCGENPSSNTWNWLPEWLEEKVVFDSVVNTFNARQFIVDFMKKKRELSHEAYLYQRDIDEIENEWSDEECEKVANRILRQVEIDFTSSCCPFCIKFHGDCDNCSYGKRHEVCSDDVSDFGKYIKPIAYSNAWPDLLDFVNNYPGARK